MRCPIVLGLTLPLFLPAAGAARRAVAAGTGAVAVAGTGAARTGVFAAEELIGMRGADAATDKPAKYLFVDNMFAIRFKKI